jgi:hypothetical protein
MGEDVINPLVIIPLLSIAETEISMHHIKSISAIT